MKGLLKKVSAVFKRTLAHLPLFVGVGGIVLTIGSAVAGGVASDKIKDEFVNSEAYIEQKAEDLEFVEDKFASGEMSKEEYEDQKGNIGSDDYVDVLLNSPEFYKYKTMIKNSDEPYLIALGAGLAGIVLGGGSLVLFNATGWGEDLKDSSDDDWNWAKYEKRRKEEESTTVEIKY